MRTIRFTYVHNLGREGVCVTQLRPNMVRTRARHAYVSELIVFFLILDTAKTQFGSANAVEEHYRRYIYSLFISKKINIYKNQTSIKCHNHKWQFVNENN